MLIVIILNQGDQYQNIPLMLEIHIMPQLSILFYFLLHYHDNNYLLLILITRVFIKWVGSGNGHFCL
jgi:hypothetical protein